MNINPEFIFHKLQIICDADCGSHNEIRFEILKEIQLQENAVMYILSWNQTGRTAVIIYDDGTLFHLNDWQGPCPETAEEIESFEWRSEYGKRAVVFNGLPKVFM